MMKLYYFEFHGRAEAIRQLLFHAGIKFEDIRVKVADWPALKPQFELNQMPVLEVDGRRYCQSYAILEYLGAKYGYLPTCYDELYKVMFIMNTIEDVFMKAYSVVNLRSPLDAKGKEDMKKQVLEVEAPLYLGAIEKKLKQNCTQDFMVGSKYTIADFYILGFYASLLYHPEFSKIYQEPIAKGYPVLRAYAEKRMADFNPYYKKCKTKLYYFDMPGRAEMIRVMLKQMKVPFEDVRIKFEDWAKEKASGKFELQQLPVIECEPCGVNICQTDAIMHRIGGRFGYLPTGRPEKLYKVLWWCNTSKDLLEACAKFFGMVSEERKKKMQADLYEKLAPTFFAAMESRLKLNKTQCFLVGKSYTLADFYLIGVWRGFILHPMFGELKAMVEKFPTLKAYIEKQNALLL